MAVPGAIELNQAVQLIGEVVGTLQRIPDAVRGWVDAFNPAAGKALDHAFRSLAATIGYAMEPIIHTATRTVNAFAGAIMNAMDRLRPAIERTGILFSRVMQPVLHAVSFAADVLADALDGAAPLIELVGEALEGVLAVANVVAQAFFALDAVIRQGVLGAFGDLKRLTDILNDGFVSLATGVIAATAMLLSFAKQDKMLAMFLARLAVAPQLRGRAPAPEGFQLGGLEDIYRRRLLAAAQGAGGTVQDKQLSAQERIAEYSRQLLELMRTNRPMFDQQNRRQALNLWNQVQAGGAIPAWLQAILLQMGGNRQDQRNQP